MLVLIPLLLSAADVSAAARAVGYVQPELEASRRQPERVGRVDELVETMCESDLLRGRLRSIDRVVDLDPGFREARRESTL